MLIRVEHHFHFEPSILPVLERILAMGTLTQAAVAELTAEAQDSKTKIDGLIAAFNKFPEVVAAAVADALAQANVDDAAAAAAIDAARNEISNAVDAAVEAAGTDSSGEPVPDAEPAPGPDTTGDVA